MFAWLFKASAASASASPALSPAPSRAAFTAALCDTTISYAKTWHVAEQLVGDRRLSDVELRYLYSAKIDELDPAALLRAAPEDSETALFRPEAPSRLSAARWMDVIATLHAERAQALLAQAHAVVVLAADKWTALATLPPSHRPYNLTAKGEHTRLMCDAGDWLELATKGQVKPKASRAACRAAVAVAAAWDAWYTAYDKAHTAECGKWGVKRELAEAVAAHEAGQHTEPEGGEVELQETKVGNAGAVRTMETAAEGQTVGVVLTIAGWAGGETPR